KRLQLLRDGSPRDARRIHASPMADFKNLLVWQKSHALTIAVIEAVEDITGNAGSILRKQIIRSILSVGSNIAEGSSKRSDKEFARFIRISLGSSTESENHLILLKDLHLLDEEIFEALSKKLEEVGRMLSGLEAKLTRDSA
ncbi:MAG TPA: four helix bundle protein, partial [Gemmatimonadaceae bacterium]|nr:four helix bundle protein [Gemmatimonadaceae bacterium]